MTFKELYDSCAALAFASENIAIEVEAWNHRVRDGRRRDGSLTWSVWSSATNQHYCGPTAEAAYRAFAADHGQPISRNIGEVAR